MKLKTILLTGIITFTFCVNTGCSENKSEIKNSNTDTSNQSEDEGILSSLNEKEISVYALSLSAIVDFKKQGKEYRVSDAAYNIDTQKGYAGLIGSDGKIAYVLLFENNKILETYTYDQLFRIMPFKEVEAIFDEYGKSEDLLSDSEVHNVNGAIAYTLALADAYNNAKQKEFNEQYYW